MNWEDANNWEHYLSTKTIAASSGTTMVPYFVDYDKGTIGMRPQYVDGGYMRVDEGKMSIMRPRPTVKSRFN